MPQQNVDYKSLPLAPTPEEYFLLSRIDGNLTIAALCSISGLSHEATMTALGRLRQAGLIRIPGTFGEVMVSEATVIEASNTSSTPPSSTPPTPTPTPPVNQPVVAAPVLSPYRDWPQRPSEFTGSADLLAEAVEIDEAVRRDLEFRHAYCGKVDYYQFLGVARDAPRQVIRDAYFALSKQYHPDLFFGKELGSYQSRIELIFQELNRANQILGHKGKRATYDAEHPVMGHTAPTMEEGMQQSSAASVGDHISHGSSLGGGSSSSSEMDERKRELAFGTLIKRAEKHEAGGDYQAAAEEYRNAFSIKQDASVVLRAANLLMRCGEEHLDEAVELAKLAAAREPQNGKPLLLMGDAYEEKGDYALAHRYYKEAQRLEPSNKIIARRLKYLEAASR